MPRTIGLVAIMVCAVVAAAVGAVTPAPPPPPPVVAVVIQPPAGVPGAAVATAAPGVVPPQQRVSFSISNAAPVEEGEKLTFRITRSGDDGQAHEVHVSFDPRNLVTVPEQILRFEPGDAAQKDLLVQTAPGLPGDGNHDVRALLDRVSDGTIGVPREATGTVTDVPLPEKVTYGITSDGSADRGADLHFTVRRTGPLGPAKLPYSVAQDGATLTLDMQPQPAVEFAEDSDRAPLVVPGELYQVCGSPPWVTLQDGAETNAQAQFSNPPPDYCRPPPPWYDPIIKIFDPNDPKFPIVIVVIVLITGITTYRIIRKPRSKAGSSGGGADDGDDLPKSLDDIEPSLEINPGPASFHALEEPASRWPKFTAEVTIEPGGFYVTQPLPRLEPDDG